MTLWTGLLLDGVVVDVISLEGLFLENVALDVVAVREAASAYVGNIFSSLLVVHQTRELTLKPRNSGFLYRMNISNYDANSIYNFSYQELVSS